MYAIIAGSGRLGVGVAKALSAQGHDVVVVDAGAERRALGDGFDGIIVDGSPIDFTVLEGAGLDKADLFIAASGDDRRNILAAQIAADYGVPRVLVRIVDTELERFYAGIGLATVCPTTSAINQILGAVAEASVPAGGGR
jgi:trk system potassium uptake protein TrkA